ncbi:D-Ala-D-Ala carboxypeptidase family metallohydrolase [Shewanella gaetbuli]|uniref:D-Ala-D-Ala carboxypeptidase family metallohydrolase n=1 Tax=Shewanella gaetbuli TaxID=220752 RepID=A0A9X1ZVA6_9GAMM|nr:D-Ala-D-Ala carboxypeptidase family metallohydrolase [Shewanella gaetbuli]MCL1142986.1 D-Ala-D-Ala carboxypeptidase family metallohydrolase [Shewanella gaetbuli]
MTEPFRKNFPKEELRCKCSVCNGALPNHCDDEALTKLQAIREEFGEPMPLSSAFRCRAHPAEAKKPRAGYHNKGVAFDVRIPWGASRIRLVEIALKHGAKGFGFANSFIHIDFRESFMSWTYR